MRFNVPQFIEHEAKIVGPLTFKQFVFIGLAVALGVTLYFTVPFTVFLIGSALLGGLALALAFLKVNGIPFPKVVLSLLKFSGLPKIYIWQRREEPIATTYKKDQVSEVFKKEKEGLSLKTTKGSRLKKLQTEIETKYE